MRNIAKIMRMDWIHIRAKVLVPTLICILLFLPFAVLCMPQVICCVIPVSGLAFYSVVNTERRWSLERFYATLPFTRAQFIFGRFCSMCAGLLCTAAVCAVIGHICVPLRCYIGRPGWYAAVLRWNATGYQVWQTALFTFAACCLIMGFQFLLLFLFGTEHETAAALIGFPVMIILLVVLNITVLELTGMTALDWVHVRFVHIRDAAGVLYAPFIALLGVLWMLLAACISALLKRKGEWK